MKMILLDICSAVNAHVHLAISFDLDPSLTSARGQRKQHKYLSHISNRQLPVLNHNSESTECMKIMLLPIISRVTVDVHLTFG